jgi:hypothetical protein
MMICQSIPIHKTLRKRLQENEGTGKLRQLSWGDRGRNRRYAADFPVVNA